jgi:hypothetical protein
MPKFKIIDKTVVFLTRAAHIDLADWLIEFWEGKNNAK